MGFQLKPAERAFASLFNAPQADFGASSRVGVGVRAREGEIYAYRMHDNSIGLRIPTDEQTARTFRPGKRGKAVAFSAASTATQPYAELSLTDPRLRRVFVVFCDDVLETITREAQANPLPIVRDLLNRWRQLFEAQDARGLPTSEEVGLLCELCELETLLDNEEADPVARWTGPGSERHDFELNSKSIECKATTAREGLNVAIHGSRQLEPSGDKPLTLVVRRFESSPDGQLSLQRLSNRILSRHDIDSVQFLSKLQLAGYSLNDEDDGGRYSLTGTYRFSVGSDFPRVEPAGAADRIQNLQYTLVLTAPEQVPGFDGEEA